MVQNDTTRNTDHSHEDFTNDLYDKTVQCPVCKRESKNRAVKKSSLRIASRDSDSMVYYNGVNPSFYEVMYCPECGYAALPAYFETVKPQHASLILQNIAMKWNKPSYPLQFDEEFAIKQLKLALHIAILREAKDSEKGLICLKLSWIYRLLKNTENERRFQEQAVVCLENAYMHENLPIAGMDEYSLQYLIGELYRRIGNEEKALQYYSSVLVAPAAPIKLKEKIRDQKELLASIQS